MREVQQWIANGIIAGLLIVWVEGSGEPTRVTGLCGDLEIPIDFVNEDAIIWAIENGKTLQE